MMAITNTPMPATAAMTTEKMMASKSGMSTKALLEASCGCCVQAGRGFKIVQRCALRLCTRVEVGCARCKAAVVHCVRHRG